MSEGLGASRRILALAHRPEAGTRWLPLEVLQTPCFKFTSNGVVTNAQEEKQKEEQFAVSDMENRICTKSRWCFKKFYV